MTADWLALATAPVGFSVPPYAPPASDLTVIAPLLWKPGAWCAQAGCAPAGAAAASSAVRTPALAPD